MITYWLKFITKSDSTFGRGDGLAGILDVEIQHDKYGLPFLNGRTVKGLLEEERANILFALKEQKDKSKVFEEFQNSSIRLFGISGNNEGYKEILHIGSAQLPQDLRNLIAYELEVQLGLKNCLNEDILNSLTAIRWQTSIDEESGASKKGSLRSMRVILRKTPFEVELSFIDTPSEIDLALLSACVKAFRRAGTGRNRGRGELVAKLYNHEGKNITKEYFSLFREKVMM